MLTTFVLTHNLILSVHPFYTVCMCCKIKSVILHEQSKLSETRMKVCFLTCNLWCEVKLFFVYSVLAHYITICSWMFSNCKCYYYALFSHDIMYVCYWEMRSDLNVAQTLTSVYSNNGLFLNRIKLLGWSRAHYVEILYIIQQDLSKENNRFVALSRHKYMVELLGCFAFAYCNNHINVHFVIQYSGRMFFISSKSNIVFIIETK